MFNLSTYESLLEDLKKEGLVPSVKWEDEIDENTLFLRHDIDFSVEFALKLARIESKLSVFSTYFFMLTSNMYNLLSLENQLMVKEIAKMGHKVSLHFDPTAYDDLEKFKYEKDIFENIFGVKVDIVSVHRPGPFLDNNNISLCGIPQTYNDIYFKSLKYISDSGGRDIMPQIIEYFNGRRTQGLQLLIHPIWWIGEGTNATDTLNSWRKRYLSFITSEIQNNCKTYKK
ncbi:hypothetical protein N9D61_03350 [Planktomarina sp.]|nr:hypothetical protein [Planktomarina sp.]